MKRLSTLLIVFACSLGAAFAQMNLPQPSPASTVNSRIGMTDVTIEYSSPGVKGRTVWGELEKWDVAWRAGANAATKITFSTDVKVGGKELKAGSYSLFLTPHQNKTWEWHFQEPTKSVFSYQDQETLRKADIARIDAVKEDATMQERLVYFVSPLEEGMGHVTLYWEKVKVSFPVEVAVEEQKEAHVKDVMAEMNRAWRTFQRSAQYYMGKDNEKALELIGSSMALRPDYFWNTWVKSQILAEKGDVDAALDHVIKALELGEANPDGAYNFYKPQAEKHKEDWMPKASKEWMKAYKKKNK